MSLRIKLDYSIGHLPQAKRSEVSMNKQSNALNARQKGRCAKSHSVRREKVFERYSFNKATRKVFALAAQIAQRLDDTEVFCSHVFA